MDTQLVLAAVLVSTSLAVVFLLLSAGRSTSERSMSQNEGDFRAIQLAPSIGARAGRPMLRWLAKRSRRITPRGVVDATERRLAMSGFSDKVSLERMLSIKFIVFGAGAIGAFWLFRQGFRLAAVGVFISSYFIVDLWLSSKATERAKKITLEIPDIMDQLTISVEAGLGFEGALSRVSKHEGELAREFARTLNEIQLGVPRSEALRNMVKRTGVSDLRWFVASMVHAESFGIPIGRVLRTQSEDFREKRKMRAHERAQRLPVMIVFPLVAFIFPALFIVLLGPAGLSIMEAFSEQ